MTASRSLLVTSLALNATFLVWLAVGAVAHSGSIAPAPPEAPSIVSRPVLEAGLWTNLPSGDLSQLVARLRAEGFPPEFVRAIVTARIDAHFASRLRALNPDTNGSPLAPWPRPDAKRDAASAALWKERSELLKALLGPDPAAVEADREDRRRRFGDLPGEKIEQVTAIQDRYYAQLNELYGNARNGLLPAEQAKLNALARTLHEDLAKVLNPQELLELDLRSSDTANRLRSELQAFDATENEYKAIFALSRDFDERFGAFSNAAPSPERSAAEEQLRADLKAALGAERYDEYQRARDPGYQQTSQLVARLDLPADTANQIWTMKADIESRRRAIANDATVDRDARDRQLASLALEAKTKLTAVLGERGYDAYAHRQNGGWWLEFLQPAR